MLGIAVHLRHLFASVEANERNNNRSIHVIILHSTISLNEGRCFSNCQFVPCLIVLPPYIATLLRSSTHSVSVQVLAHLICACIRLVDVIAVDRCAGDFCETHIKMREDECLPEDVQTRSVSVDDISSLGSSKEDVICGRRKHAIAVEAPRTVLYRVVRTLEGFPAARSC